MLKIIYFKQDLYSNLINQYKHNYAIINLGILLGIVN